MLSILSYSHVYAHYAGMTETKACFIKVSPKNCFFFTVPYHLPIWSCTVKRTLELDDCASLMFDMDLIVIFLTGEQGGRYDRPGGHPEPDEAIQEAGLNPGTVTFRSIQQCVGSGSGSICRSRIRNLNFDPDPD